MTDPSTDGVPPGLLASYLNDHLAGATGGIDLFRWVAAEHRGTPAGEVLERLADEVATERQALLDVMAALDVPVRYYKVAGGWLAEKVLRFSVHGGVRPRSALSSVLELEALHLAVLGKCAAWRLLRLLADADPRLDGAQFDALTERALEQSRELETLRLDAARRALLTRQAPLD